MGVKPVPTFLVYYSIPVLLMMVVVFNKNMFFYPVIFSLAEGYSAIFHCRVLITTQCLLPLLIHGPPLSLIYFSFLIFARFTISQYVRVQRKNYLRILFPSSSCLISALRGTCVFPYFLFPCLPFQLPTSHKWVPGVSAQYNCLSTPIIKPEAISLRVYTSTIPMGTFLIIPYAPVRKFTPT